jgi:hypothetical protein
MASGRIARLDSPSKLLHKGGGTGSTNGNVVGETMAFNAKITYEDDVVLERVYRLRHIVQHFRRMKEKDPSIDYIKSLPITPWLIAMAFEETVSDARSVPIKCIEIQERVIL